MTVRPSRADWGLVSLVVGGIATCILGGILIAVAAFLGVIPLFLVSLFALAGLITLVGAAVTIIAHRATIHNQ